MLEPAANADSDPASEPLLHEDRLDYTPVTRCVTLARRRTARLVAEWGHPDLVGDVSLVTSELMTNALLHGSLRDRLIRVHLTATATTLRVEVSDPRGERLPTPRLPKGTEQFGRGLLLVAALADDWGAVPRTVGKTVYAEWNLTGAPVLVGDAKE
ncbi:ATP-binding protein [Streptomyces ipomoeae]|uniref:ATP-binding protein n=1 Tax=Streptomyces ipomoeae TaxID=103232 RepID=A0AAE8W677_9ACTN|nr:ATP-binding protein [Streptomyces ipomoeae]TQE38497.1 ATP-binding protein [Streptomyces ipomoeae]